MDAGTDADPRGTDATGGVGAASRRDPNTCQIHNSAEELQIEDGGCLVRKLTDCDGSSSRSWQLFKYPNVMSDNVHKCPETRRLRL